MSETTRTKQNPFPGLRPFGLSDESSFFGRGSEIDKLSQRLESTRFVIVAGPLASGKSSLVRAGVLPALGTKNPSWRSVVIRPGAAPVSRLARELARIFPSTNILESDVVRGDRLEASLRNDAQGLAHAVSSAGQDNNGSCLVVVDEFEQLFYLGERAESAAFVKLLLNAAGNATVPVRVVLTLGADFLGDCAQFGGLTEVMDGALYLVPRLSQEHLREAIEGPARQAGEPMAPDLVERILRDTETVEEPLPSLQYVLRRLYDSANPATLSAYEALGGLAAIGNDADRFLDGLSQEERRVARRVFVCITYKVPAHRGVSWPTRFEELVEMTGEPESLVRQVVDKFRTSGDPFIGPPSSEPLSAESVIEISHDSLIRAWRTLRTWVDEEDGAVNLYRQLADSAERHAEGRGGVWTGAILQLAGEKVERKEWNSHWAARLGDNYYGAISFLEESLRGRKSTPGNDETSRSLRRTRVLACVLGVLFVAGLALAFYAYQRHDDLLEIQADATRLLKEAREKVAATLKGMSRARLEKDEAELQMGAALRQKEIAERERQIADSRSRIAENRQKIAETRGAAADARERSDRQRLYVANMNLADRAFEERNLARGQELLNAYLPGSEDARSVSGGDDLRSFYWYHLWRNNHQELATLHGHAKAVSSLAFSPDGQVLATGGRDGDVMLWDYTSGRALGTIKAGRGALSSVAFSPDGKLLAAGSRDGAVKLWDARTRVELGMIEAESGDVFAIAFTPDGDGLAVGSRSGSVTLWDPAARTKLASFKGHERDVYALAFSPDGKLVASGSQDDTVRLWDVAGRKAVATLEGKGDDVQAVAFSPDGKLLATGSKDGAVRLWDVGARKVLATLEGTGGDVYTVTFSPDGRELVAGLRNGAVKVWDVGNRKELTTLQGHGDAVNAAAFTPDGRILVTGSQDRTAKLWSLERGEEQNVLAGKTPIFSVAFAPKGNRLATGSVADTVKLWDLGQRANSITLRGSGEVLFSVAFSPDGAVLATGSKNGTVKLWDVESGQEQKALQAHDAVVFSVAFSPDGKTLATGSWDGTVKLWNVASGETTATLKGHDDSVFSVAFSPNGEIVATGSKDTTVRLWDVRTATELTTLGRHADAVFPVAFSPDGTTLASASRDGAVKLWDVVSRQESGRLKGHLDSVSSLGFSPDGRVLATGSLDDTVKVWDLETRQELATLKGHTNDVYSVGFSPDGRVLATGSLDGTVRLWEAATDETVAQQR